MWYSDGPGNASNSHPNSELQNACALGCVVGGNLGVHDLTGHHVSSRHGAAEAPLRGGVGS